MKKPMPTLLSFRTGLLAAALLSTACATTTLAQARKKADKAGKEEVNVKIIERTDAGEVRELERTYRLDGLKDDERDALVNRLVDSLRAGRNGKRSNMTIIIEGDEGSRRDRAPRLRGEVYSNRPGWPYAPDGGPMEFRYYRDGHLQNRLRFNPDSLADRMRRFEFRFPQEWSLRMDDAFRNWSWSTEGEAKASTIRNLQVFPNNPEQHELNVRFTAPGKGDIQIRVTTPEGKEVARREVKDFSGSYSGQVDLGRKAKGVYFVQVTQNEDGAVRRVVLP